MWNCTNNIDYYETLLKESTEDNNLVVNQKIDTQKLCRTCLKETSNSNNLLKYFKIGVMNINFDGKSLKLMDMYRETTGLHVRY